MEQSTTIIKNINGDRVMKFTISNREYLAFTVMRKNLVVIDNTDINEPILLLNRAFSTPRYLEHRFDVIIVESTKAATSEDFVSKMDTYISLKNSINNTTDEIISTYKIVFENDMK